MGSNAPTVVKRSNHVIAWVVLAACTARAGGEDTSSGTSTSQTGADTGVADPVSYSGPGSLYDITLSGDGTFDLTIATTVGESPHTQASGTYMRLGNGFVEFAFVEVMTSEVDVPQAGSTLLAVELEGMAMFLWPSTGAELIPMLVSGECPTTGYSANWLVMQGHQDEADQNRDFWGQFDYTHADSTVDVFEKRNLSMLDASGYPDDQLTDIECATGTLKLEEQGMHVGNVWLTQVGGAIVETFDDTGVRDSSIVALPATSTTGERVAGTYATLLVQAGDTEKPIIAARAELTSDGSGSLFEVTDVHTGAFSEPGIPLQLTNPNQPGPGWWTGTMGEAPQTGNMTCSAVHEASSSLVACLAQNPDDASQLMAAVMTRI